MKIIKLILVIVLILTSALYGATEVRDQISGKTEGPTITNEVEILEISVKDDESKLLQGLTAQDAQDGDLTSEILVAGVSKLISVDKAKVTYLVFDSDDNMASLVRYIRYTDYQKPVFELDGQVLYSYNGTSSLLEKLHAQDVIDGDLSEQIRISSLWSTDQENIYYITAQVTNSMGDTAQVKLPVLMQDYFNGAPQITLSEYLVYVNQGSAFDAEDYLRSGSYLGSRIPNSSIQIDDPVDTSETGTYWVTYRYTEDDVQGLAILTVVVQ